MKNVKIRLTSVLLLLMLLASSLIPVYAVGSNAPTQYSTSYNSGSRGVVCTSLDGTSAASYYKNHDYDTLSELSPSDLFNSLQALMRSTHTYISSYDDCHYKADRTDCTNGSGNVLLLYTSYSATMDQWDGWNREHVWPKSLGGGSTTGGGADMHHIRPSDAGVNSSRGNKLYGESDSTATEKYGTNPAVGILGGTYNSTYFEPLDCVKGDVARICLYVYVRWYSDWGAEAITDVFQSVDVLLAWCELDPVDTWEMGRNEVVGEIQGNRNVFIDYPEYAWLLFGKEVPDDLVSPSGEGSGNESGGSSGGTTTCRHTDTTTTAKPATCTVAGSVSVVCESCGVTVSTTVIQATGHIYADIACVKCGHTEALSPKPSGNGYWTLVTDASELKAGDQIILVSTAKSATYVAGNISSNQAMASVGGVSVSGNTITTLPSGATILTLGGRTGAWTLSNAQGQKLGATTVKKLSWTGGTNTWSISISGGNATVQNSNSSYGRFLYNVSYPRFTTYTSDTNANMLLPQIYKYVEIPAEDNEVKIQAASMILGADLSVSFYVSGWDENTDYSMVFTMNGKASDRVTGVEKNGYLVFTFTGISPQHMGDRVSAALYGENDTAPDATLENFSVRAFAEKLLTAHKSNQKLMDLIADMLRYGAAAQLYENYKTNELVTDGLDLDSYGSQALPTESDNIRSLVTESGATNATNAFTGLGVRFDFDNKIFFKFKTDDLTKIKITVNGTAIANIADKVQSLGNGVYIFYTDGICATEFDEIFTFRMYVNGTLHQTVTYSVNSYAFAKCGDPDASEADLSTLSQLVRALYRYGLSATAYLE
jgi:endonuclease I